MADFVAVIRRAVDGLTDNTPELRARVYEKARGAVVRQLENMKPRPPEAMFQRQIDKLDAAIRQVEEENSAALPAEAPDEAVAVEAEPAAEVPQPEEVAARPAEAAPEQVEEITAAASPLEADPLPVESVSEEPAIEPVHVEAAPAVEVHEEVVHAAPVAALDADTEELPAEPRSYEPAESVDAPVEPVSHHHGTQAEVHAEPARSEEPVVHSEPEHLSETEPVHHEEPQYHFPRETADLSHEPEESAVAALHPSESVEPVQAEAAPVQQDAYWQAPVQEVSIWDREPETSESTFHPDDTAHPEAQVYEAEPAAHKADSGLTQSAGIEDDVPQADAAQDIQAAQRVEDFNDPLLSHFEPVREPAIRHAANRVMEQPLFEAESEFPGGGAEDPKPDELSHAVAAAPEPVASRPVIEPVATAPSPSWDVDIDREPEVVDELASEAPMPRAALTEADVANDFSDFLKTEFATPAVQPPPARKEPESEFSWDAPFDDLPDLPKPVAFEDALHARQEQLAKTPDRKVAQPQDARAELEDLIGYAAPDAVNRSADGDRAAPDMARAMPKLEGKSFRVHRKNKRRFNPLPIAFGIGAALVVAGGAYGFYVYRDDVSALVASLMPSDKAPVSSDTRAVEEKLANQTAEKPTDTTKIEPAKAQDTAAKPAATDEQPTEVASLDGNIVPTKFTQRLMADGTEAETDAAKIPVDQSLSEGKTIAGQTEVAAAETDAKPADQKVETPGLTVTQKMFLYEERLGDSPLAVPGTVSWALKTDSTGAGGKEQPMVEATVEVPERKLKAIVSFKRNTDPSLPASHIVEVVFDLPDNFPEGNVESVQRIAFKQTEQDRGNSLIAVPAKITDDFHMIALNDDADARKVNTELMKTRSWIDIPIVYRNNRRALITFEKGASGTEAFDKAMAEWAALGPTATGN